MSKTPAKVAALKAPASKAPATKLKPQPATTTTPSAFVLGDILRCRLTGFVGIAVVVSEYLYGCRRWGLQGELDKGGKPSDWRHFDEPQLERLTTYPGPPAATARTGGPRPDAPPR